MCDKPQASMEILVSMSVSVCMLLRGKLFLGYVGKLCSCDFVTADYVICTSELLLSSSDGRRLGNKGRKGVAKRS